MPPHDPAFQPAIVAPPVPSWEAFPDTDGILYFGNDWFGENRTSSHHVARRLARVQPVVYIESPGLRVPTNSGRDLRKLASKLRLALAPPRRPESQLVVETLLQLPFHGLRAARLFNKGLVLATARRVKARHRLARPIAWFTVPHLSYLVGRLGEALSVYYRVDDFAEMPGVDRDAVRRMDEEMSRKADLVFVTSETMLEAQQRLNPHTHVSPHGVDFDHFSRAQDPALPVAPELANIRGPVIGYFGLIERWTDLALVAYCADRRPDWTFVLIGLLGVPQADVPRRPNILYLGKRPYADLPAYGKRFDACITLYKLNAQTVHANPIKLREYLAMGKPVVSVALPQAARFADVVRVGRTPEEFLAALDQAVADNDPARRRRQQTMVASMTWEARVGEITRIVTERLRDRV